jgi:hypothetical protein
MTSSKPIEPPAACESERKTSFLLALGSMKFGIVLLGVLAAVLIFATLLEAHFGPGYGPILSNLYVYKSGWFIGLLGVLCVNIFAAILGTFPWKNRWGFLAVHSGVLVLALGAMLTFLFGLDESLSLVEGEKAENFTLADWGAIKVILPSKPNDQSPVMQSLLLKPGPVDWPEGKAIGFPEERDVKLKIAKYFAHARADEQWAPSEGNRGEPAVRFAIVHEDGTKMVERWLAGEPLGGGGIPRIALLTATADTMREDFSSPPGKDEDKGGVLSIHYGGRMQRIPVSANVGKKIPLDDRVEVEIVNYFADVKMTSPGQFESAGDEPKNPVVELRVYLPDHEEPLRELAFAKMPLMSLTAMRKQDCPVKLWYHQPAWSPAPTVEFLRTPDGKLYCRTSFEGKFESRGEVRRGSSVEIAKEFRLELTDYVPFAERRIVPVPVEFSPDEKSMPGDAAQVEVEFGGAKKTVWLMRNNPKFSRQVIDTPEGELHVAFGDKSMPLGFSLALLKCTREMNPGRMGDAAYSSTVRIVDEGRGVDREAEISMNRPLTYDKFAFYQSGMSDLSTGEKLSTLKVTFDPGRWLKYLGSLLICGGMALRYISRWKFHA